MSLAGRVVLLDFWTYGCINCLHVLPDLEFLERRYRNAPFQVVGVHSGKFDAERNGGESLDHALLRHSIAHPVVRDDDHAVRRAYAVRAWPTLVLVDARGYVVAAVSGEGHREALAEIIDALLAAAGEATAAPLTVALSALPEDRPLLYPGAVLADAASGRLFVADTGHHRIVAAPLAPNAAGNGGNYTYIGSGTPGLADGAFAEAAFRGPQGLGLSSDGNALYVADTENHAVRRADLRAGTVTTVAGTGRQALEAVREGSARATDLNSPWALALSADGQTLYIAMAGAHQIVRLDLDAGHIAPLAGSGREGRADGTAFEAAFAQPSGIALYGDTLYVADAESSCVRAVTLAADGQTATAARTLAGGDLFDFGFADGAGDAARFQHPTGAAFHAPGGQVYVSDAYNHRIRRVDPATGGVTTAAGTGETAELYEPGGISVTEDSLFIADTNRHRVRRLDLVTGRLETVPLPGLCSPTLCFPNSPLREEEEEATP